MICHPCKNKNHVECQTRNVNKSPADCDCQHRTSQKTIVRPSESGKADNE